MGAARILAREGKTKVEFAAWQQNNQPGLGAKKAPKGVPEPSILQQNISRDGWKWLRGQVDTRGYLKYFVSGAAQWGGGGEGMCPSAPRWLRP